MPSSIGSDTPLPDGPTRQRLNELNKIGTANYKGTVVVLSGTGFGASVARSILAALSLVRRDRAGDTVVKTLDEACAALAQKVSCDPAAIRSTVDALLSVVGRTG